MLEIMLHICRMAREIIIIDCTKDAELKRIFWQKLEDLAEKILTKECLFVLVDANARTGQGMGGCGGDESRVLGEYGRDVHNDNGKRLLSFATNCKLALTNMFVSTRKGGISHTHNGTSPNDRAPIDYILIRQAHRPRVQYVKVVPRPPAAAKADSDHNILYEVYQSPTQWSLLRPTDEYED